MVVVVVMLVAGVGIGFVCVRIGLLYLNEWSWSMIMKICGVCEVLVCGGEYSGGW